MEQIKTEKQLKNNNHVPNICDFSQNLDYDLQTAKERIDYVNKMMYTDAGYPVEFFEKLFDQDERIEMSKRKIKDGEVVQKYVNLFPNSNDNKYEDTYEAKQLDRISDYILRAPDQPRMDKQFEYNFYNQEEFDELVKRENDEFRRRSDLNAKAERYSTPAIKKLTYLDENGKMAFLKRMGENSKCDGRQKMYEKDYKDPVLKDYIVPLRDMKDYLVSELKRLEKENAHYSKKLPYRQRITNLIQHQEDYKTSMKGMFWFNDSLPDTTKTDYDQFDIEDLNQISEMVYLGERHEADSDLGCMTIDFENIIQKILNNERYPKLSKKEEFVLKYIRKDREITQEEMVSFIEEDFGTNCTQQEISRIYEQIAKKISEAHYKQLKDFLVEFRWDGIKKCSKCGEWKLVEDFGKDNRNSDGLKSFCKKCDNLSKKS